jgi:Family of unknown function (DUF6412)
LSVGGLAAGRYSWHVLWLSSIAQITTASPLGNAGLLAVVAAVALAAFATLLARRAGRPVPALHVVRAIGVRQRAARTAFVRQRDPDAAGRPRPRAPSADPAA